METTTSPWPPRSADATGLLTAYTGLLSWPLLADRVPVAADAGTVLTRLRNTEWSVLCGDRFDAVSVPAVAGRETALLLERDEDLQRAGTVVPCLVAGDQRFFFVRPGTAPRVPGAEVLSGESRVVLPPTFGLRWETPPWARAGRRPLDLPDGQVLTRWLRVPTGPPAHQH
ncbi:hypothetical protein [Streptomyces yaizuensis]|uniref:DNA primase/polymerase bifunctional N-terminal domain-containing protein n=1 Tax=Streptomyces yaizuensis TaxID=2989713 RepID=A0ABQ5P6M5_9ACTN|nr:hypothetical protein [Streptomyces sp. YSPA8]GLF98138.1 hypothetical protein SYYSPA8_27595 [Streptomyces sp. YSPA8]